jgi:hypothetical protein
MFGKLKKIVIEIEALWAYVNAHKDDIAQLQKELKATQATLKKLTPPAPVKKTIK